MFSFDPWSHNDPNVVQQGREVDFQDNLYYILISNEDFILFLACGPCKNVCIDIG